MTVSVCVGLFAALMLTAAHAYEVVASPAAAHPVRRHAAPLGLTADVKGELEETLFVKVLDAILPAIVKYARDMTIKGEATKHFSFSSFKFSSFNIAGLSIGLAAPNVVRVSIDGLTLSVPHTHFDVYTEILFFKASCSGDFWVSLAPSRITLDLHISTNAEGKLVFSAGSSSVVFGSLDIHHELKEFLCRVGEDIIQIFIGNLDTLIRNIVEKDLPKAIAPLAEKALNGAFAKLPLVAVGNPTVTAQGITVQIDLIASLKTSHADKAALVPPRHRSGPRGIDRDVVLTLPQLAIDHVLIYEDQIHHLRRNISVPANVLNTTSIAKLIPAVAKICDGCPVAIDVEATVPPSVAFANASVTVNIQNLHVRLAAVDKAKAQLPLFSLNANLSLIVLDLSVRGAAGNVIWFQLNVNDFSFAIDKSEVGPIKIDWLSPIVDYVLKAILIPDFNEHFKGLTLPALIENVVLNVTKGNMVLALNAHIA